MERKLRVGIIGFGRMGRKYLTEFKKNPMWEVVYICDIKEKCRIKAAELSPTSIVTDSDEIIFKDPTIDVVGLFALADTRYDRIKRAIEAGKHIVAEKPVAMTIQEEWDIVQRIEKYDKMVTVNLFNRNAWYHKEIIDFIGSGQIGELAIIRISHQTPGLAPEEGHQPEGPSFHDCGMHYVDVARWYANSEYKTWHAQGVRMWSYEQPWWLQVHGTFENNVVFDITQGFVYGQLSKDQTHNCYVDIIGTKGIARMTHNFKTATIELHGTTQTTIKTRAFNDKKIDVLIDVFGRSIIAGENLGFPCVLDSVIASDIAWKIYENAIENNPPAIGTLETLRQINHRRRTMNNGYGILPQ